MREPVKAAVAHDDDSALARELAGAQALIRLLGSRTIKQAARIEALEAMLYKLEDRPRVDALGGWLALLAPSERPEENILKLMGYALEVYPVELTVAEGLWVADRCKQQDWKTYGTTLDEAMIRFLRPDRLRRELPPSLSAAMATEWPEMQW